MTPKELHNFCRIFLQNNKEYESIILIVHNCESDTQMMVACKQSPCPTINVLSTVIEHTLKTINEL